MGKQDSRGMSRREFAKASAAAGFAILGARGAAAQTNDNVLKAGLIGCGGRGTGAAINMLEGNENVALVALADVFEDKVAGTREQLEGRKDSLKGTVAIEDSQCFVGFDAYQKLLGTDIDIMIEGTLPYSRPKHIAAAVEAKKHIFSEKPIATDPVGIRTVMEAGAKHKEMGLSFVAGTQRRHQKPYIDTIQKIHDGAIGDVLAMRVYWCGGLPFARDRKEGWSDLEYCIRNWYSYCWTCADNIVEQHVHNLDIANWVLGTHPAAVFASGGRAWKPNTEKYGDIYDHFSCDYTYDVNGRDVHVYSFSRHWNRCAGDVFEEATGTGGVSNCRDMGEDALNPYVQEHIDLVNSICGTGPYYHEAQQVAESTLTAIMGRMSAYTGKRLTWEDALNSDLNIIPDVLDFSLPYPVGRVPCPVAV